MKRRKQLVSEKLSKAIVGAKLALALLALAMLCISAIAQENTAEGWYKKGLEPGSSGGLRSFPGDWAGEGDICLDG